MQPELRFVFSATAVIAATYGLSRFGYGLFVPAFGESFKLTPALTGVVSSGSFFSYCVAAALAYRLAGSPRLTVLLAGVLATFGSAAVAVSVSPMTLAVSMLIAGAGAGFASPGLVALVQEKLNKTAVPRAQAVVNSGTGFGVVIAGPLALLLADKWRIAWVIIAAINVAATIAVLKTSKPTRARSPSAEIKANRAVNLRPLLGGATAALLTGVSSAAMWIFSKPLVVTESQLNDTEATIFWVVLGAAGVAGAFTGDLVTKVGLFLGWMWTAVLMGLATLVVGLWPSNLLAVYAGGGVFGASYVALSGVLIAWASDVALEEAAAGTAALFICLALGQAAGSLLIGPLLYTTGSAVAFTTAAVLACSSTIPVLIHAKSSPRRTIVSAGSDS